MLVVDGSVREGEGWLFIGFHDKNHAQKQNKNGVDVNSNREQFVQKSYM